MKIHSIKFKITLLLVVTVTCLVAMLIGFNSIFSEKVYMNRKQKSMINSYENVNEIMQKYTDSQIDKDTMCADMENISTAKGISVLVVDSSWCTIYVSTQGDDSMMERLRMSIFNGDIFKNNGSQDKAPEPKDQEDDSDNPADKDDKKEHRKRLEDIIDMSGTSLVENRTIISSNDNYTLQKVYDERLGDYYLEIWGTLDNGYSIILRTPIQGIKDNVNISTTLIKYVGGAILAVGIIAAFVVSTYITRPIKQLSNIAEKMSEMDFEPRLTILHQAGMLSEEDYRKVQDVIRFFQEKYGLTLTEENASAMITHLCAALGRIHRGEPVEPLDEEVYEETSQEPTFPKALEATQALVREILPDLPEDEQKFLTMHIGVVLAQS